MNLAVQFVDPKHVVQCWGEAATFLDKALSFGYGDYNVDQLKALIILGHQTLLVAVDEDNKVHGAASISFVDYPNSRVAFITAIGGHMVTNEDTFAQLKLFLVTQGATSIRGCVRPSMVKFSKRYGFSELATLVEVKL